MLFIKNGKFVMIKQKHYNLVEKDVDKSWLILNNFDILANNMVLANMAINVKFHGCKYSTDVMYQIDKLIK